LGVSWHNQKMMLTLSEIKAKVNQLAQKIGASQNILPTYGYSEQTARPHIEVSSVVYYYVIAERGQEINRYTAFDVDELLYKIFADVTFELSSKYELAHRLTNQDSRRIMFQRQVELLSMLSPKWAERESREHEQILKKHPFDDYAGIRATLSKELREQGNSSEVAWKMACEKYPLPKEAEQ
jgi:hypothetical protein